MPADLDDRLAAYVDMLKHSGAVRSPLVEWAFRRVRRDRCVTAFYQSGTRTPVQVPQDGLMPDDLLDMIYSNTGLVTHLDADGYAPTSSSSQPTLMAKMLEALDLRPGMRVLEIGAGTGYNAALVAVITDAEVVTVDASAEVVEEARQSLRRVGASNVRVIHADGYLGHAAGAPYQRVIVTVGCAGVSPHWLDQLGAGGGILAPIAHGGRQPLLKTWRDGDAVHGQALKWADFMPATGPLHQWPVDRYLPTKVLPAAPRADYEIGPALDLDAYDALWFYLGIRDRYVTRAPAEGIDWNDGQCALVHPDLGNVFALRTGHVLLNGDDRLVSDVARYRQEWEDLGRPAIPDWSCDLALTGAERSCLYVPSRWRLGGRPLVEVLEGSPSR